MVREKKEKQSDETQQRVKKSQPDLRCPMVNGNWKHVVSIKNSWLCAMNLCGRVQCQGKRGVLDANVQDDMH